MSTSDRGSARIVGRYAMYEEIAAGGMATVHLGRLLGPVGFSRTVAIKRLHPQFARNPDFCAMFLDEAKLAARIRHPNVVPVIDIVSDEGELLLVMDYVHGESFAFLLSVLSANKKRLPPRIVANVIAGALTGLHAAHEATSEAGAPLGIVHRDVSPQNILLGTDGVPRVLDFGVAKAAGQSHTTREGTLKGKLRYAAPEQIRCSKIDHRVDVWAASVVLWEALTGHRLFWGDSDAGILMQVLERPIESPRRLAPDVPEKLAEVCMRGLARDPDERFSTALEMAACVEAAVGLASPRELGAWVRRVAQPRLEERAQRLADIDADSIADSVAPVHASLLGASAPSSVRGAPMSVRDRPSAGGSRPSRFRAVVTAVALVGVGAAAAFGVRELGDRARHLSPLSVAAQAAPVSAPSPAQAAPPTTLTLLADDPPAASEPPLTSAHAPPARRLRLPNPTTEPRGPPQPPR